MGRTGWFVDACTGSAYDLTAAASPAPARPPLDRFSVDRERLVIVIVDLRVLHGTRRQT